MEALSIDPIYEFNGNKALIREISPHDKELILAGMQEMKPQSIYHRFFAAKKGLSDKELISLTEFDKRIHYAIGACTMTSPPQPMGIGRFDIQQDCKEVAEFAITIIDKYQGIGLGKELLGLLIIEAKKRGIKVLQGEILNTNFAMIALAQSMKKSHGCELKFSSPDHGTQTLSLIIP